MKRVTWSQEISQHSTASRSTSQSREGGVRKQRIEKILSSAVKEEGLTRSANSANIFLRLFSDLETAVAGWQARRTSGALGRKKSREEENISESREIVPLAPAVSLHTFTEVNEAKAG